MIELLNTLATVLLFLVAAFIFMRKVDLNLQNLSETVTSVKNVLEFLGDLPRWLQYYSDLTANVQKLEDKKDKLQKRLEDQRQCVEDEEYRTGRVRKKEVDHWLTSAETELTDVQNLLLQINGGANCFSEFLCCAWWGNQVEKMILKVEELYRLGVFENGVLSAAREMTELPLTPLVGKAARDNIRKITTWLGNGVTEIGIHGNEGIGKTALMKHIHNQLLHVGNVHVYMVTVPKDCSDYQLQHSIVSAIGVDLKEEDILRRAALLHRSLKRRNFVLILDGLTKHFALENVGIPLDAFKGKMIITSRYPDVCRKMGCHRHSIEVTRLMQDEALYLFKQKLHHRSSLPDPQLDVVASQIVERCRGVALKIVEKASDLTGIDDLSVWQRIYNDMSEPDA